MPDTITGAPSIPSEWGRAVAAKVAASIREACGREADRHADVADQIDDACDAAVKATLQALAEAFVIPGDVLAAPPSEALAQALAAAQAETDWQDISTAPKDGTVIILGALAQTYQGKPVLPRVTVGNWTTEEDCRVQIGDCGGECRCPEYRYEDPSWMSWDGGFTEENPATHWMPLPAPPTPAQIDTAPGGRADG